MRRNYVAGEAQVANDNIARVALDENVVAFEIAMNNVLAVQVGQGRQDLRRDLLDSNQVDAAIPKVARERAVMNDVRYEVEVVVLGVVPLLGNLQNVRVIQLAQYLALFEDFLPLALDIDAAQVDAVPCDVDLLQSVECCESVCQRVTSASLLDRTHLVRLPLYTVLKAPTPSFVLNRSYRPRIASVPPSLTSTTASLRLISPP